MKMENFNFGGSQISKGEILQLFVRFSIVSVITYCSVKWMMSQLDPTKKNKKNVKSQAKAQLKRLSKDGGNEFSVQQFNEYELMIASHLVVPADIQVSWENIAGLDAIIQEFRESVVFPVRHRNLFNHSKLWQAPKGVLLHGPPGCGKTLIAKATAKECGMRFINLNVAMLTDKWYGESQKLTSAVFSLAAKIQPCIIFIDEIDSFLRNRNSQDHEATAMMKTLFMMLWDGLSTNPEAIVIVMGATNRPQDLDKAIIRRMPAQFHIGLPYELQRKQILQLILQTEDVSDDVDLGKLARLTNGFSGSDLKEMCRNASVYRIRNFLRKHQNEIIEMEANADVAEAVKQFQELPDQMNSITNEHLIQSYQKMRESKMRTGELFHDSQREFDEMSCEERIANRI